MFKYTIVVSDDDMNDPIQEKKENNLETPDLLHMSSVIYSIMTAVGTVMAIYIHQTFPQHLYLPNAQNEILKFLVISLLGAGLMLLSGFLFESYFNSYDSLRKHIRQMVDKEKLFSIIFLAIASSVGEEVLFRAGLQPLLGLFFTSIIFGMLHIGPEGSLNAWTVWAFLAGLLLGWIYQETQNLWPPILAHFLVNCFSLIRLKYMSPEEKL